MKLRDICHNEVMEDARHAPPVFSRATAPFVIEVPDGGVACERLDGMDVYLPRFDGDAAAPGASDPLAPLVVFVPGPAPLDDPPRDWCLYRSYGRLAASRGIAAIVAAPSYPRRIEAPAAARELEQIMARARQVPGLDAERVAVWAFSGGALLVGHWLARSPSWLRGLALSYPLLHPLVETTGELSIPRDVIQPGRPVTLIRVGLERPDIQTTVDAFVRNAVTVGASLDVVDVPEGVHAFDMAPPVPGATEAVLSTMDRVVRWLESDGS